MSDEPLYRDVKLNVVIVYDDEGNYVVHGNNTGTPAELFKAVGPLWAFDPSSEHVIYRELDLTIPVFPK